MSGSRHSSDDDVGHIDLVIKVYFRGVNDKFPDGGVMSQHMESLKLGDSARPPPRLLLTTPSLKADLDVCACLQLLFQGPKGKYAYKGRGLFAVKRLPSQASIHAKLSHMRKST